MKAENCDRYGCTIAGRRVKYSALRHYVCDECGGAITHRFTQESDSVACAACGSENLISESRYLQQISEGWEVLRGLPPHLRALVEQEKETDRCQSETEAIDDLTV